MIDILDNEMPVKKTQSKLFSRLALFFAIVSVAICCIIFYLTLSSSLEGIGLTLMFQTALILRFTCLFGVICNVISFIRKEPRSVVKWLGAIINFLLLILVIGLIVFALKMDNKF